LAVAFFAGRFDPVTNGHLDIAKRAAALFERLVVGVADSKSTLFSTEERMDLFREAIRDKQNVTVMSYRGLTVDVARSQGATVLIRSMRGTTDFEQEFDMALMNRQLYADIETLFLAPDVQYSFLSASLVREVARLGGDVTSFVSGPVLKGLKRKLRKR